MSRTEITDSAIVRLRGKAAAAGDPVQFALCARALGGRVNEAWSRGRLPRDEHTRIARMSVAKARAACAAAIAGSAAQIDD